MVTSVAMGNIIAIIFNTFLITKFGVHFAFIIPGAITILLGIAVFFATHKIKSQSGAEKKHLSMWKLIKDRQTRSMLVPAIMHGVMKENITLWMTVFIVDKYCVDLSSSSYYVLLIPVIGFIGRILYPMAYKLSGNRENTVSVLGFVVCIVSAVVLCVQGIGALWSVILLSLIYTAVSVINTSILSIYPLRYLKTGNVSSVSGVMDFATYLGGGVASVIYGVVIANYGYIPMFVSWAIISVVSVIMLFKIDRDEKITIEVEK
jgi:sugar phosphate permease